MTVVYGTLMLPVVIHSAKTRNKNSYTRDIKSGQCGFIQYILMISKSAFSNQQDIGLDGNYVLV